MPARSGRPGYGKNRDFSHPIDSIRHSERVAINIRPVEQTGVVKPEEGNALAYIDWQSQEFGIAAALSGDTRMQEAYRSGDPYLAFAKQSGAVPPDATKHSHKRERDVFKMVVLGVGYGMEAETLAGRIKHITTGSASQASAAPRNLSALLAMVARCRGRGVTNRKHADGIWLERACGAGQ